MLILSSNANFQVNIQNSTYKNFKYGTFISEWYFYR